MCLKYLRIMLVICAFFVCGANPAIPVPEAPENVVIAQFISAGDTQCDEPLKGEPRGFDKSLKGTYVVAGGCVGAPRGCVYAED